MHIILNCGNDEVLLSQMEDAVVAGSEWGQLITEDPNEVRLGPEGVALKEGQTLKEGLVREPLSQYGGSGLTPSQLEGLREAKQSIEEGKFYTDSEIWEEFDKKHGFV